MKVLVTGGGAIGRHVAADLVVRGHEVTLIEQDRATVEDLRQEIPEVSVMLGDACEPWVLDDADLVHTDVVVAATGDDEDNLVTALLAKQEFAVPRVLARVNHPKNEWLFTDQWGVDTAVSPPHMLTSMVEEAVTSGDLVQLLRLEGGRISIVEMKLEADSPAAGTAALRTADAEGLGDRRDPAGRPCGHPAARDGVRRRTTSSSRWRVPAPSTRCAQRSSETDLPRRLELPPVPDPWLGRDHLGPSWYPPRAWRGAG